uniref:fibronectin type III domain-containing protein n=1 Tax=Cohnella sp. TaxID=1883426 RepID=UPI0035655B2E
EVFYYYRDGVYYGYTQDFDNLQFTATGLAPNTTYTFTVKAKDKAQNWGPFSNPLTVKTDEEPGRDTTPPTAPGNLSLVSKTEKTATMKWTASTDESGIEVYDIYRNGVYYGYTQDFDKLQFTATGLAPNTTYTFTVKAKDKAQNWGPFSNPLTVTTDEEPGRDTTPPTAPGNLRLVSKTSTAVAMRWNASTDASGIEVYDIYLNGIYYGYTQDFDNLQFTATGLAPNTTYTFTVKAKDKAQNWGPFSNPLTVTTDEEPGRDTTPPTAPGNLRLVSKTSTTVTMRWNASTDASGIEVYDIYRNGVYYGYTQNFSNLQFTATGLTPNTNYTFTVKAKDKAQNWGPFSNPLTVRTNPS